MLFHVFLHISISVEMGRFELPSENGHKYESSMRSYTFRF